MLDTNGDKLETIISDDLLILQQIVFYLPYLLSRENFNKHEYAFVGTAFRKH